MSIDFFTPSPLLLLAFTCEIGAERVDGVYIN